MKGEFKGIIYVLGAAISFALSVVSAKFVYINSELSPVQVTFYRFVFGFFILLVYIFINKKKLRVNNWKLVLLRAFSNTITVIIFFLSIQLTTTSKANMLNNVYPIFVFIFSPLFTDEKNNLKRFILLLLAIIGIYLVINPDFHDLIIGDFVALFSGLTAAFAIVILRLVRKIEDSYLILFYLMGFGLVLNGILVIPFYRDVSSDVMGYIIVTSIMGFLGQVLITQGYRYIEAGVGSVVAATRIFFVSVLGVFLFSDPITWNIILGGVLLVISLFGTSEDFLKWRVFNRIFKSKN